MIGPDRGFIPLKALRAALTLGVKYECERFKITALHQLKILFPNNLSDWDAMMPFRRFYEDHALELLELVLSFGDSEMLPSAYYMCISRFSVVSVMTVVPTL